jgi:hypothetical protein
MANYEFTKDNVCLADLQDHINESGLFTPIVVDYILIEDGDQITISMTGVLSETQESLLETLVNNYVCEDSDPNENGSDQVIIEDDEPASTATVWSSERIIQEIESRIADSVYYTDKLSESCTTSGAYSNFHTLDLSGAPNGLYRLGFTCEMIGVKYYYWDWDDSSGIGDDNGENKSSYRGYVRLYDMTHDHTIYEFLTPTGSVAKITDFSYYTILPNTVLAIQWKSRSGKNIVIRNAKIEARRIN